MRLIRRKKRAWKNIKNFNTGTGGRTTKTGKNIGKQKSGMLKESMKEN
jgi:hypothetical protein